MSIMPELPIVFGGLTNDALLCQKTHAPRGYHEARPTTMVSITIEDSGIGMEQDFVDNHIFKPFAKANVHAVSHAISQSGDSYQAGLTHSKLLERSWSWSPTRITND